MSDGNITSNDPISRAMSSLDSVTDGLRELGALVDRQQREEAERLKALSAFHGIRIIQSPHVRPNEIEFHVGENIWRLINVATAEPPKTPPETAA